MTTINSTIPATVSARTGWALRYGGEELPFQAEDVGITATTIDVSFEVDSDEIADWRRFARTGDVSEVSGAGGYRRVVDKAGRASPVILYPPDDLRPPLVPVPGYIQSYQEAEASPDRYTVALRVSRRERRADQSGTLSQTGDWQLTTERGTLGLPQTAVSQTSRSGSTAAERLRLTLRLTATQAAVAVEAFKYPSAVVERSVPGGANEYVDTAPNNRQTITVTGPGGGGRTLPDGSYAVADWSLAEVGLSKRRWHLDVTLVVQNLSAAIPNFQPSITAIGFGPLFVPTITDIAFNLDTATLPNGTLVVLETTEDWEDDYSPPSLSVQTTEDWEGKTLT